MHPLLIGLESKQSKIEIYIYIYIIIMRHNMLYIINTYFHIKCIINIKIIALHNIE